VLLAWQGPNPLGVRLLHRLRLLQHVDQQIVAWAARLNSNKAPGSMVRALRDLLLPLILKRKGGADSQR
jgi:hypothetical protein